MNDWTGVSNRELADCVWREVSKRRDLCIAALFLDSSEGQNGNAIVVVQGFAEAMKANGVSSFSELFRVLADSMEIKELAGQSRVEKVKDPT